MDTQETKTFTLILIIFITLGTILFYFIVSLFRQHRRNLKLQKSLVLAELAAIERERVRIAADLHDDVCAMLSVIKFQINTVETAEPEEMHQLREASHNIDDVFHRVHDISSDLMSASLERKGLQVAVEDYLRKVEETSRMKVTFSVVGNLQMTKDREINIYRIVQEVLHNCRKHAKAKAVSVHLERQNYYLSIFIQDDGIGFDYKTAIAQGGIGLTSLRNRTRVIGGSMQVESEAGRGTAFMFKIPLR